MKFDMNAIPNDFVLKTLSSAYEEMIQLAKILEDDLNARLRKVLCDELRKIADGLNKIYLSNVISKDTKDICDSENLKFCASDDSDFKYFDEDDENKKGHRYSIYNRTTNQTESFPCLMKKESIERLYRMTGCYISFLEEFDEDGNSVWKNDDPDVVAMAEEALRNTDSSTLDKVPEDFDAEKIDDFTGEYKDGNEDEEKNTEAS